MYSPHISPAFIFEDSEPEVFFSHEPIFPICHTPFFLYLTAIIFDNSEEWTTSKPWRPCVNYCPTSTPITFFRQVSHHPLFPHMARPTFPTYDRHIVFTPQRLHDLKEPAGHLQSGSGQGRHHLQHEGVFLSLAHFPICHTPFFLYNSITDIFFGLT
jgi:hypothetical protein